MFVFLFGQEQILLLSFGMMAAMMWIVDDADFSFTIVFGLCLYLGRRG